MASGMSWFSHYFCFLFFLLLTSTRVACFAEDEVNLLVIVVDVNPIWWGQQAQREPEVPSLLSLFHPINNLLHEKHKSESKGQHIKYRSNPSIKKKRNAEFTKTKIGIIKN